MLTLPFEKIITYNFRLVNTFFKIFSLKIYFFRLLVASIVLQEFIFVHSSTLFIHSLTEGLIQTNEKSRRKSAGFFYYRRLRILIFFKGLGLSAPFFKVFNNYACRNRARRKSARLPAHDRDERNVRQDRSRECPPAGRLPLRRNLPSRRHIT